MPEGLESKLGFFQNFSPRKAKAEISLNIPTDLSKSTSQAVYGAIDNRLNPSHPDYSPNDVNEVNWLINVTGGLGSFSSSLDNYWPEDSNNYI